MVGPEALLTTKTEVKEIVTRIRGDTDFHNFYLKEPK